MNIRIIAHILTDGSETHDVVVGDCTFPANSQRDAIMFAFKIADAINEYTTETAHTTFEGEYQP